VKKALRVGQIGLDWLIGIVIVGILALVIATVIVPRCMGGTSLAVLTGSMEPAINPGDLVATRGVDARNEDALTVGQVIAFLPYPNDPMVVTHRIIAVDPGPNGVHYTTKGDANDAPDPWGPVADTHVRGEVAYVIPKVGYVREWVMRHFPEAATIVGVALILYGVFAFGASLRRKKPAPEAEPRRASVGPRRACADEAPA